MAAAREREFGVRVALGSSRGAIAALVLLVPVRRATRVDPIRVLR
jgi:hypothetical protein